MTDVLEEYINGPYEEDPLHAGTVAVVGITQPVQLRLYRNALVLLLWDGTGRKHLLSAGLTVETSAKEHVFRVRVPQSVPPNSSSLASSTASDKSSLVLTIQTTSIAQRDAWVDVILRATDLLSNSENLPVLNESLDPDGARHAWSDLERSSVGAAKGSSTGGAEYYGLDSLEADDDFQQPAVVRKNALLNARYVGQCALVFVIFACAYTAACRMRIVAVAIMTITWIIAQPAYYIYPWAIGKSKFATIVWVGFISGLNIGLSVYARWLFDNGIQYPDLHWTITAAIRMFLFAPTLFVVLGGFFYFQAWRRDAVPKRPVVMGRRGRCQYDTSRPLFLVNVVGAVSMLVLEPGMAVSGGAESYVNFASIYYTVQTALVMVLAYLGRRKMEEYSWEALTRYLATLAFGTFIIGRLMRAIIAALRQGIPSDSIDTVLPFVFIIYKLLFVMLYPYFMYLTLRMGRRREQMKWMYPAQVMDAFVLDTFAIVSNDFSSMYFVFVALRVLTAVAYQAGLVRRLSNRCGLTSPSWSQVEIVGARLTTVVHPSTTDVVSSRVSDVDAASDVTMTPHSARDMPPSSVFAPELEIDVVDDGTPRTPSEPAPESSRSPQSSFSTRPPRSITSHLSSAADNPVEIGSKLYHVLREPCGDSPLGQWLFFVQGAIAGLMSIMGLMIVTYLDTLLPEPCIFMCRMSLSTVQKRAVISLLAWILTIFLTFLIAKRNFLRTGFSNAELITITARHLRESLPVLLTFSLPVVTYVLDITSLYIKTVNNTVIVEGVKQQYGS